MKKCSHCGYVRRPIDDEFTNAPANACPKCYSFYTSEATAPDEKRTDPPAGHGKDQPLPGRIRKTRPITYWLAAGLIASTLVYFIPNGKHSSVPLQGAHSGQHAPKPLDADAQYGSNQPKSIADIVKLVGPSVVSITVYNGNRETVGRGSGFFVGTGGHIISNYHVLKGFHFAEIKTSKGGTYPVNNIIAEDRPNDLVMVSTGTLREDVKPVRISSELPQVGEKIVVIGNPLGLDQTVSDGIVSAFRVKESRKIIQITAPISPGSSGSPVVNMAGEVIGVAFMHLVGGQNLNFCIPGERIAWLGSNPGPGLTDFAAHSADRIYCYLDENKSLHFVKNPESTHSNYVLLTTPDGSPDRERFEKWVFEILGGNPYKIDPQAEVEKDKSQLPEHFRRLFPGHEIEQLGRFSSEARAYWGSWVANRFQSVFDRSSRARQEGIAKHKQLMQSFDSYMKS